MSERRMYPFDPADYPRGSYMEPEAIEQAFNVSRTDDYRSFKLCQLKAHGILRTFHGPTVSVVGERDGLRVLEDGKEQFEYTEAAMQQTLRRLFRRQYEQQAVTTELLTDEQKRVQAHRALVISRIRSLTREKPDTPELEG